ncbi:SURF1 family protein [Sphingobium sp. JS3065]|uniref:SURF1 family protein n=1 Tax=Sphingobium sp. JS3065 TaxID=2970925 RepID=UPI0022644A68|nr:SURF1 family protein [Sphingobium sp. JS3065]UZW55898.1 SURF1 family protein [Sphingobium sp. JS3065]
MTAAQDGERSSRSPAFMIGLTLIALFFFAGFCALGAWQVQRLGWKRDLIARVDARSHALPLPAPRAAARADEYRRVKISGHFLHDQTALVQAVTVRGPGFWVLTPLVTDRGLTLIVNRGFVPLDKRRDYARPQGKVHVAGLLRLNEPGGGFLRSNDPAADRWYSRDVEAIADARGIKGPLADYFIDAEAVDGPDSLPVGGLTVVKFPNSHLQYAIIWFVLAAMVAGAYMFVMRQARKDRRG